MSNLYDEAMKAMLDQDEDLSMDLVKKHLDSGASPSDILTHGFIPGINKVGELFSMGKVFMPELILSAEIMGNVVEAIKKAMPESAQSSNDKIVVVAATVRGDLHDIGKGIGVSMFRANGWEVHDLGRDVDTTKIIDCAVKNNAHVIATSALLTTTLSEQKKLEKELVEAGIREKFVTMVAGAPVTQRWANQIGASIYAEDSHDAMTKINAALGKAA